MVKHIVIWKLKEVAHGNDRQTNANLIKEKLLALRERIPGIVSLELGYDLSRTKSSGDIVLYSEFVDMPALAAYQVHPEHEELKLFIGEATEERHLVDYEVLLSEGW
ncbi:MAG: Dabb family protein [Chlorobium sp.]